ncbi:UNVERIFIED_CONTAM: protein FAR-RED ELONGATED HYPOCOTYL 1 [Sesamum latifolium]|uniref:Protein FAR-RED ELONGATED HYPOCOTYL 1 n=1 Tax=Sesamum latifolium TaxID=2727402 RepID=A0AAW2V9A7_9LAMI
MPLPKHVCWGQSLESDSLLDSSTEPKKVQSNNFARGCASDTESAKDSNSFHCNEDSFMSTDYESKTETDYPETSAASYEHTSSSVSWADSSSEICLYSSKSTSLTKSSCSEPESLSITEQLDRPDSQYGLGQCLNCDCSEYRNEGIEQCTEKEVGNLLYSNGVAPGNYVLSSGRWSVNQDTQQEGKKLTIDKEFEQYFAMLML